MEGALIELRDTMVATAQRLDQPIRSGTYRQHAQERVVFGRPAAEVLAEEVKLLERKRVFLITNRTLEPSAEFASVRTAIGREVAGVYAGVTAHTPRECVVTGAIAAKDASADLLIAIGGGSVIDAAKAMLLCLRYRITDPRQLDRFVGISGVEPSRSPPDAEDWLRMIAAPTTFSAAEFAWYAGVTDTRRSVKEVFGHPLMVPQVVVLDPRLALTAPQRMLLSTGVKAVDHAAERLSSLDVHPFNDALCSEALRLLATALPLLSHSQVRIQAVLDCQLAMWMSTAGKAVGVGTGASHAIGHVLGAQYGIPHGETSCTTLPAVMRWNRPANGVRQQLVSSALGQAGVEAADVVAALVARLGLPTRLRDLGVSTSDFPEIAEKVVKDFVIGSNPRKITGASDVQEILELAW